MTVCTVAVVIIFWGPWKTPALINLIFSTTNTIGALLKKYFNKSQFSVSLH